MDFTFLLEDWCDFFLKIGATRKLTHLGADYESTSLNNVRIDHKKLEISDFTYTTL
jgi:hypothetical protein